MRIGILTFHRSINYGAFMQGLALSHELQRRFPEWEIEIIDYNSFIMEKNYKVRFKLNKHTLRHPMEYFQKKKRKQVFRESLKYLPLSPEQIIDDGCGRVFDYITSRYDAVVTGSDAVWNWIKRGFPNPYLLCMDKPIPRFSYAASAFGMGMEYVTEARRSIFGNALKDYFYIGVRDEYTASLVRYCAPDEAVFNNCDPTAFLDLAYVYKLLGETPEQFKERIYSKYRLPRDKRLICIMGTDRGLVRKLKEKYGKTHAIIAVFSATGAEDRFLYDLNPLEWALIFGFCDLTLTNFFHGTLLSLRNATPVISIDQTKFGSEHRGKMPDALHRMKMDGNFFRLSEARENGWSKVLERTDMMLSDPDIRQTIEINRAHYAATSASFFDFVEELEKR